MDAQRLADALRVYLDEFGIRVETRAAADAADLRDAARGRARSSARPCGRVAVVRAEHGARGTIEIELVDLATDKALVVSVPRPARDEDLYRALALKIQAVLRATLSEARARSRSRDRRSGRLVARERQPAAARRASRRDARARLGLDVGYGFVSFPDRRAAVRRARGPGVLAAAAAPGARPGNGGARVGQRVERRGRRDGDDRPDPRVRQDPVRASAGPRSWWDRASRRPTSGWPPSSATTPVRSTRNLMSALGAEAEARLVVLGSAWLFARAAALGVLNGERYDVAGPPLFDTSRLQLSRNGRGRRRVAVIFQLTEPPARATMEGVGTMPDPSRPPAPEVAALVDRARRRDPEAFRRPVPGPRRRRAPGRAPDGGRAPGRRGSGADDVRRGVPIAARLSRRRAVLDLADAHRGPGDAARRAPAASAGAAAGRRGRARRRRRRAPNAWRRRARRWRWSRRCSPSCAPSGARRSCCTCSRAIRWRRSRRS